ncbi:MAG: hypothetical protein J6Z79_00330 [Clostridia bacterium]|nr:hypothetical protein [Clostridia bacterium]
MTKKKNDQSANHIYHGTDNDRKVLRIRILTFALVCLACAGAAFILGMNGPEKQYQYVIFAVGEVLFGTTLTVMASILAAQKGDLRDGVFRWTIAAIPGICLALILCDLLTVIAALVHLGRYGAAGINVVFLLAAILLRLLSMELAHLCRRTVTHSIWSTAPVPEN